MTSFDTYCQLLLIKKFLVLHQIMLSSSFFFMLVVISNRAHRWQNISYLTCICAHLLCCLFDAASYDFKYSIPLKYIMMFMISQYLAVAVEDRISQQYTYNALCFTIYMPQEMMKRSSEQSMTKILVKMSFLPKLPFLKYISVHMCICFSFVSSWFSIR